MSVAGMIERNAHQGVAKFAELLSEKLSLYMSVNLSICVSICPSSHLLSVCQFVSLSTCLDHLCV